MCGMALLVLKPNTISEPQNTIPMQVDLLDDEDLEELHAQRLRELQAEARRQSEAAKRGCVFHCPGFCG
jgi:hypothetical protein